MIEAETRVRITNGFGGAASPFHNKEGTIIGSDNDGWWEVLVDGHEELGPVPFYAIELTIASVTA